MTSLTSIWPLMGLSLATPRLILRPITDDDIPAAVAAAASGIHDPRQNPFSNPWTELPPETMGTNMAQWYWRCRGQATPEEWTLLLGIWAGQEFIGCQDIGAKDFAARKTVSTGSWLRQSHQGQGLGKEMRSAVLLWAFDWLKAEAAHSEAAVWNAASLGVSASLGYSNNGVSREKWGAAAKEVQHVRVTASTFIRPEWTLQVAGHEAAAAFLTPVK